MADLTNIPILPQNISINDDDSVTLSSHSLKSLVAVDIDKAVSLINENGFNVDASKISWDDGGRVVIKDFDIKEKLKNNQDIAALNVCGLCKVT